MKNLRQSLAHWLLAGFACYSCVSWTGKVFLSPPVSDEVGRNEERYSGFQTRLQGVSHVGYLVQSPGLSVKMSYPIYKKYILAQLALAPTILDFSAESEWVVFDGDLSGASEMTSSYDLVEKKGNELALFRRRPQ